MWMSRRVDGHSDEQPQFVAFELLIFAFVVFAFVVITVVLPSKGHSSSITGQTVVKTLQFCLRIAV